MGRLRYMLFQFSQLLPKKQRYPIFVLCSFLGWLIFMNFMIDLTSSAYLISIRQGFLELFKVLQEERLLVYAIVVVAGALLLIGKKNYRTIKSFICLLYVVVILLGILPFLIGG